MLLVEGRTQWDDMRKHDGEKRPRQKRGCCGCDLGANVEDFLGLFSLLLSIFAALRLVALLAAVRGRQAADTCRRCVQH